MNSGLFLNLACNEASIQIYPMTFHEVSALAIWSSFYCWRELCCGHANESAHGKELPLQG